MHYLDLLFCSVLTCCHRCIACIGWQCSVVRCLQKQLAPLFSLEAKVKPAVGILSCYDSVKHAALSKGYVTSSNEVVLFCIDVLPPLHCLHWVPVL